MPRKPKPSGKKGNPFAQRQHSSTRNPRKLNIKPNAADAIKQINIGLEALRRVTGFAVTVTGANSVKIESKNGIREFNVRDFEDRQRLAQIIMNNVKKEKN